MTIDYVERSGTGGPGTAIITNDDKFLLVDRDEDDDSEKNYGKVKDPRSF